MIGSLVNPNLVYSEYSGMADELSNAVIRQIAKLVGYNSDFATGIFTQGGTFCNLYGYLTGIRKSLPEAKQYGMGYIHDYRIINSQGATTPISRTCRCWASTSGTAPSASRSTRITRSTSTIWSNTCGPVSACIASCPRSC